VASNAPIFIIGTERSGSNLLRVILTSHSRIDVPHPPHVMKYLGPLEARYGDLSQPHRLQALTRDVLKLLAVHIHPWESELDAERIAAASDPPDLLGIFFALQERHMEWAGKARWGNKSTFMLTSVDRVLAHRPGARFIWLVRDPRDVAASSRKSVFSPFHPFLTAQLWAKQQAECLELAERLGSDVVLRVHYEDLVAEPEATVARVCEFLDEAFEPAMLQYHESSQTRRGASLSESWQNTAAPVLRGNAGKWRKALSAEEAAAVEGVCGELMHTLGYATSTTEDWREPSPTRRLRWQLSNERDRLRIEWRSLRKDTNHWRRWGRAVLLGGLHLRHRGRPS
jgi:hypothetical protein